MWRIGVRAPHGRLVSDFVRPLNRVPAVRAGDPRLTKLGRSPVQLAGKSDLTEKQTPLPVAEGGRAVALPSTEQPPCLTWQAPARAGPVAL